METSRGEEWEVSYDTSTSQEVIFIDVGDVTLTLTQDDLKEMLEFLGAV